MDFSSIKKHFSGKEGDRKEQFGDLGMVEDTFELCKNLTSMEAHGFGSFITTKDKKYAEFTKKIRELRTKYLSMITKREDSQIWCISKHIVESCMRLQEIYTRFLSMGKLEEAEKCADDYGELYLLFLELNNIDIEDSETQSEA